jgi:2-iminobutanoate/2-iminopropanoate deaminase
VLDECHDADVTALLSFAISPNETIRKDRRGHAAMIGGVNRAVTPTSIAPPVANYAHAVVSERAGRLLHTAGVVPILPDGAVPPDLAEQADVVWANIAAIVAAAGMAIGDIVSVTTYVVAGEELGPVMAARDRAMAGHVAASTLVTVPALARPEWRVEVAVVAAAP